KDGTTAFFHAATMCSVEVFIHFLSRPDLDINTRCGEVQHSILSILICFKREMHLRLLLQQKRLRVNEANSKGETALMDAVFVGHEYLVKLLLSRSDIDINARN
ncbi:hypothetical protein DFH27DRAFT_464273, partial [Peziza echinospora]